MCCNWHFYVIIAVLLCVLIAICLLSWRRFSNDFLRGFQGIFGDKLRASHTDDIVKKLRIGRNMHIQVIKRIASVAMNTPNEAIEKICSKNLLGTQVSDMGELMSVLLLPA